MATITARTSRPGRIGLVSALAIAALGLAPAAQAAEVFHDRGGNRVAQVVWGEVDELGAGHFGNVAVFVQGDGLAAISTWEEDSTVVICDDLGNTDPSDDVVAFRGIGTVGWGEISGPPDVSIPANLKTAVARADVRLETVRFDGCSGATDLLSTRTVEVTIDLTATGRRTVDLSRYVEHVPDEYTRRVVYHSADLEADGVVTFDGQPLDFEKGRISYYRQNILDLFR